MSDDPNRPRTVLVCKVSPNRTIRLEDIPAKDLSALEDQLGASWLYLVGAPMQDVDRALAMYRHCCQMAGVEPKELTAGELIAAFDTVVDDRPDAYTGGLPDPKADGQTTELSSGV
jgi:hypothetical protein